MSTNAARADDFDDYQHAREAYTARNWTEAIQRFRRLVGTERSTLSNPVYVAESRKYLAAAYMFDNQQRPAEQQFEWLLDQEPDYEIDANEFPAEVVALFRTVDARVTQAREDAAARARREQEAERERDRQARIREQQELERLREQARQVRVERSRVIASVPFGVGQFQNDSTSLGIVFAASQAVFGGAAIAFFAAWLDVANSLPSIPPGMEIPAEFADLAVKEQAFRVLNQIAFGLWGALTVAGIVEAHVNFVATDVRVRVGPLGGSFQLAF